MTRSDGSNVGNRQTYQDSRRPIATWWRQRFSETDRSVEEISDSFEEPRDEFWTGLPEKYELPQEDLEEDDQTKLESVGDPPEEFNRAFEVVNRLHEVIQDPQGSQTQFTPETPIGTVVEKIPRAGPIIVTNLKKEGYKTLGDLDGATTSELKSVKRVGTETAERLIEFTQKQKLRDQLSNQTKDRATIEDSVELDEISDQISGFGGTSRKKIEKAGYETVGDIRAATANELTEIKQIGEGTVSKLLDFIENDAQIPDDTSIEDFAADVPRVGRVLVSKLTREGYETVGDLRAATVKELTTVEHIGEKKAESLLEYAK